MRHLKFFVFLCILTFTVSCGQQKKYIQYKVKKGETMRVIAKRLDMKTKDLLRLNPDVGRKPVENSVIVIPNRQFKGSGSSNTTPEKGVDVNDKINKEAALKAKKDSLLTGLKKNFVIHEVKPKETIYGLKRFYNVTAEELFALNPELSEGLKIGQIIKIKPILEGEIAENEFYEDVIQANVSLKVALMLPFMANNYTNVPSKDIFQKSTLANIVTDYYLGAQIAIDSLRKQGVQIDLNVYDTERKGTKINALLSEKNLNENDVIIGPLYSEEAEVVANKVKVPVIFPFHSKNQSRFSSSKLIKASPEKKFFREELTTYIKDNFTSGNLILVGDGKSTSNSSNNIIKQSLIEHEGISVVHLLKPNKGYIAKKRFLEILKPNENNWVILTTDDTIIVADAINSLISLPTETSVKVFSYNKGKAYDKIANSKLAKVNLTYVSDEYVNESSASTQLFNKQYVKKNNALPSFYATKGFDITYDVLIRLASGSSLKDTFTEGASFRVESKFDYSTKLFGATSNKGLFIVQYNKDLSLTRLK